MSKFTLYFSPEGAPAPAPPAPPLDMPMAKLGISK